MKQLRITFEDKEFKKINLLKKMTDLSWKDFIIWLTKSVKEEDIK